MSKRKKNYLASPEFVKKDKSGKYYLCWWPGCNKRAGKYKLCKEHYREYYKQLREPIPYGENDIICLNVNLGKGELGTDGQWNHGNNK